MYSLLPIFSLVYTTCTNDDTHYYILTSNLSICTSGSRHLNISANNCNVSLELFWITSAEVIWDVSLMPMLVVVVGDLICSLSQEKRECVPINIQCTSHFLTSKHYMRILQNV